MRASQHNSFDSEKQFFLHKMQLNSYGRVYPCFEIVITLTMAFWHVFSYRTKHKLFHWLPFSVRLPSSHTFRVSQLIVDYSTLPAGTFDVLKWMGYLGMSSAHHFAGPGKSYFDIWVKPVRLLKDKHVLASWNPDSRVENILLLLSDVRPFCLTASDAAGQLR